MNFEKLNNPVWHALNSHHRHLAIRSRLAARYPGDVLFGAAMEQYNQDGFDDLRLLVQQEELIAFIPDSRPANMEGWRVFFSAPLPQMICLELQPEAKINAGRLSIKDVPQMLALIELTRPGPFLPRTIELGDYWGVWQHDRLVAMAGERLHLDGFCEISAVCTHPDFRGRGYGGALTALVARRIMARGEIPFLHHEPSNHGARRLYERLGFQKRCDLTIMIVKKRLHGE